MAKANEQPADTEEPDYAAIAKSILRVGVAAAAMKRSGLADRAVMLLIQDLTKVPLTDIERVLWAARNLPQKYLSPEFLKQHGVQPRK